MTHRGIATLAQAILICFLLLSHFDGQFFLFHFYESLIYLAIVLMLFYFEDRWAYMLGIFVPAVWIVMQFAVGGLTGPARQLGLLLRFRRPDDAADLMGALIVLLSILMIVFCVYRWRREYAGLGKTRSTLVGSLLITAAYYGFLTFWFWHAFPHSGWQS